VSSFVSGLILAAGTSSRLGMQAKQLLAWRGTTLLEWVVRQAELSLLDEVAVVVGHEAEEVRRRVTLTRAKFVEARDFHEGCTASIRSGLEALDARTEAVVLILGDQPEIESEIIATLIGGWRQVQAPAVRTSYRGRPGHPLLFTNALFGQLKALHGDKGVWKLLEAHPEWVREIDIDRPFPSNINTWEDYLQLTALSPPENR
jgi:molybdenum cofactor cytidylyltransferase